MKNKKPKNKEELNPNGKKKRINSRTKGNSYERWIANLFRDKLGYRFAKTTRNVSKLLDDCGIDISGIPYCIQAKSGYWTRRPKPEEIFKNIENKLQANFDEKDPVHSHPKFLFHRLDGHNPAHHLVTMTFSDWLKMIEVYENHLKSKP